MKNKKIPYFIIAITLLALAVFSAVLIRSFWYAPNDEVKISSLLSGSTESVSAQNEKTATPEAKEDFAPPSEDPLRLTVPALEIDAKIQKVGITQKGNMAAPRNFSDVGWYKYGTVPGEVGSAVLAGHVDNGLALPWVFSRLSDLKEGDDIYVSMADGRSIHYIVVSLATYDYNAKVPEVFGENDGNYLKLVTCTGVWMASAKTHDKRLVVKAVQI